MKKYLVGLWVLIIPLAVAAGDWSQSVNGSGQNSSQAFAESDATTACRIQFNQWQDTCDSQQGEFTEFGCIVSDCTHTGNSPNGEWWTCQSQGTANCEATPSNSR